VRQLLSPRAMTQGIELLLSWGCPSLMLSLPELDNHL
jgi:hypothetical protein